MTTVDSTADSSTHKIQQIIKWVVYILLLVNFVYYGYEDWNRSIHTLTADSTFLDWTGEFATSIDESAWFLLLFMFELETYVLEDEDWTGWVRTAVRGVRLFSFALIAHTIYAFVITVVDLQPTTLVEDTSSLCDLNGGDFSYVYNLEYTEINESTCDTLSSETSFYRVGVGPIVSDLAGLKLERVLAWADLVEAIAWLLILLAIEIIVRLQGIEITSGTLVSVCRTTKTFLYLLLIAIGVYWASMSHWLYLWDEIVWIAGFAAIEMNIRQWRDKLLGQETRGVTA